MPKRCLALAVLSLACSSGSGGATVQDGGAANLGVSGAGAGAGGTSAGAAGGGGAGGSAGGGAGGSTPNPAGTGGSAGDTSDDALVVPAGLTLTALEGGTGVLEVIALTLRKGPSKTELYAAVKNTGEILACSAALSVELFDKTEQSVAAGIGGLLTNHFYRRADDSGMIAACVAPGDVTMAAVTDLPAEIVIEDVAQVLYRCPYFALEAVPIDGLSVGPLESVLGSTGTAFAGTLVNGFDVAVANPSVTVFPVNRVGRPLGVAIGSGTVEIPPGGSWAFQTNGVDMPGVDALAYPAGALTQ